MIKAVFVSLLLLSTAQANAEFFTGAELLQRLSSPEMSDKDSAFGYIAGAHDAHRGTVHCTPDGVTLGQVVFKVKKHLEEAVNVRHYSADAHVAYVLKNEWPCKKKGKNT